MEFVKSSLTKEQRIIAIAQIAAAICVSASPMGQDDAIETAAQFLAKATKFVEVEERGYFVKRKLNEALAESEEPPCEEQLKIAEEMGGRDMQRFAR